MNGIGQGMMRPGKDGVWCCWGIRGDAMDILAWCVRHYPFPAFDPNVDPRRDAMRCEPKASSYTISASMSSRRRPRRCIHALGLEPAA